MQKRHNIFANTLELRPFALSNRKCTNFLLDRLKVIYQVYGRSVDLEDEDDDRTIDEIISDAAGGKFYFFE